MIMSNYWNLGDLGIGGGDGGLMRSVQRDTQLYCCNTFNDFVDWLVLLIIVDHKKLMKMSTSTLSTSLLYDEIESAFGTLIGQFE